MHNEREKKGQFFLRPNTTNMEEDSEIPETIGQGPMALLHVTFGMCYI